MNDLAGQSSLSEIIEVKTFFRFFFNFGHVVDVFSGFFFSRRFFIFKKRWQSLERQAD